MSEETPPLTAPPENGPKGKNKFIREMISFLTSDRAVFYKRSDRVYVDTTVLKGKKLLPLEGAEFQSFILKMAKLRDSLLLHAGDADLIVDHVRYHAMEVATPLSTDPRACLVDGVLWLNPAWEDQKLIRIEAGKWTIADPPRQIFAPLPASMAMPMPIQTPADEFPKLVAKGITSFGDFHCFFCTTLATMMMPMDDVHPFIVITGQGAKGKTTTMKLAIQLVDPDDGNECMIVSEDPRNILVTCMQRKTLGLDNASSLPIPDDLLSQLFAGGTYNERKLYTTNEVARMKIERMRVFINGVAPNFSKSDFFTKAIFLEQPVVTTRDKDGSERFTSLSYIEKKWKKMLPQTFGALLSCIADGLPHYQEWLLQHGDEEKPPTSDSRCVEFSVQGEAFARAMGYEANLFRSQVTVLNRRSQQDAVSADDCAQLILSWLNGERVKSAFGQFDDGEVAEFPIGKDEYIISPTQLYHEIRSIAVARGNAVYSIEWLKSVNPFSNAMKTSEPNILVGGWEVKKFKGGEHNRKYRFTKNGTISSFSL